MFERSGVLGNPKISELRVTTLLFSDLFSVIGQVPHILSSVMGFRPPLYWMNWFNLWREIVSSPAMDVLDVHLTFLYVDADIGIDPHCSRCLEHAVYPLSQAPTWSSVNR